VCHVYFQNSLHHDTTPQRSGCPRQRIERRRVSNSLNWCPNGLGFCRCPPCPSVAEVGRSNAISHCFGNRSSSQPARGFWPLETMPTITKCFGRPSSSCYLSNGVVIVQVVSPSVHSIVTQRYSLKPAFTYSTIRIAVTSFRMCHGSHYATTVILPAVQHVARILAQNALISGSYIWKVKQVEIHLRFIPKTPITMFSLRSYGIAFSLLFIWECLSIR